MNRRRAANDAAYVAAPRTPSGSGAGRGHRASLQRKGERLDIPLEVASGVRSDIGEGPTWDVGTRTLLWVDIYAKLVHRLEPLSGQVDTVVMPQKVGAVVPTAAAGLLIALEDGFWLAEGDGAGLTRWVPIDDLPPGSRLNDAKCDRAGRFVAGSVTIDHRPRGGALYRLDSEGTVAKLVDGVTMSNGLGWSPDGSTLFHIDTKARTVRAYEYAPGATLHGAGTLVLDASDQDGTLDGMAVDSEGYLWIAFFKGSCVRRYSPDGRLDATLQLPVSLVTSCTFGGDDLEDLYITTAARGIDPADEPLAGATFRCRVGVSGLPEAPFGTPGSAAA